jgi:hypothetical protein
LALSCAPASVSPSEHAEDSPATNEIKRREDDALHRVYRLPEVADWCARFVDCAHSFESVPVEGCSPNDVDRRDCAWAIVMSRVEVTGPHLIKFATFYVRDGGEVFVDSIQTGAVVTLEEWRCLQRNEYEVEYCTVE